MASSTVSALDADCGQGLSARLPELLAVVSATSTAGAVCTRRPPPHSRTKRSCPTVGIFVGQAFGSKPKAGTSCAQRQAPASFAADARAPSREGTSTTVKPPLRCPVSG